MSERAAVRSQQALGEAIARLRYDSDLTQSELADLLGVSQRYVWEIENGKPNLFATRLFELLAELGAHLEVVWPETLQRSAVPPAAAATRSGSHKAREGL